MSDIQNTEWAFNRTIRELKLSVLVIALGIIVLLIEPLGN